VVCGIAILVGCSRQPEPRYELQAKSKELPQKQQSQIRDYLLRLFGTPLHPRFLLPTGEVAGEGAEPRFADHFERSYLESGARVFQNYCAGCHSSVGDGQGEVSAFLQPKPRDYRSGIFKFTSTPYGGKPARQDLVRIVRKGAKGTSMPSFALLSDEDVGAVVDYVTMLAYRGELEQKVAQYAAIDLEAEDDVKLADFADFARGIHDQWQQAALQVVMPLTPQPPYGEETIAKGREAFLTRGCSKCHGENGRGQTEWLSSEFLAEQKALPADKQTQINYDAWGHPAPAADLTAGMLHGGRRKVDIYRRIHNGINGTPMPSFSQALASEPDTIWHLVHYVSSIVEGRPATPGQSAASGSEEAAVRESIPERPSANE
jgi:mono/diheme cytochrome c family protein